MHNVMFLSPYSACTQQELNKYLLSYQIMNYESPESLYAEQKLDSGPEKSML